MSGLQRLENLESAGFKQNEINEWRKNKTNELVNAGFSNSEINDYWGVKEPDRSTISTYWNNIADTFKDPVKEVQKFSVDDTEVVNAKQTMDQILSDYQAKKIDKVKFESLMNEQNEILQQLSKQTETEVLGITASDVSAFPGEVKKSAVGEDFEFTKYLERGISKSIFNLGKEYYTGGKLPEAFNEEPVDTGHLERAIESLSQIVPDLPIYAAGAVPGVMTTGPVGGAVTAGATAGTIREMYIQALLDGDVNTYQEWWDIFLQEGWKAGTKEGITLGATVLAPQALGAKTAVTNFASQYAAFVGVGAALEGQMPTKDELINAGLVLGALQFGAGGIKKTTDLLKDNPGKTTTEIIQETIIDPSLKQNILSKNIEVKQPSIMNLSIEIRKLEQKKIEIQKDAESVGKMKSEIEVKKIDKQIETAQKQMQEIKTKDPIEVTIKQQNTVKEKPPKEIEPKEIKQIKEKDIVDPVEKVKQKISFDSPKEKTTFVEFKNKMAEMFLDRLHPVFNAVKVVDKKTKVTDPLNPYEKLRIQPGMVGRPKYFIEYATLNAKNLSDKGKPLEKILEPVTVNKKNYEDFGAYAVSKRVIEKSAQGIETGFSRQDAIATVNKLQSKYEKPFQELLEYQRSLSDYMLEYGMIDKKIYEIMIEANKDYVPFARVIETKEGVLGGKNTSNPFMIMKGSKRDVIDPIETVYKNTYHFITMAERNAAHRQFIEMIEKNAKDFPEIKKVEAKRKPIKVTKEELKNVITDPSKITDAAAEGFTIFRRDGHIISDKEIGFVRDGKFEVWDVGKDIATALKDMNHAQSKMILKIFGTPSRLLRAGATLAPEFMVKNVGRDTLTAGIFSRSGTIPILGTLTGIFHLTLGRKLGNSMYKKWIKSGGLQSMLVSMDRNYFAKNVKQELLSSKPYNLVKNPLEMLRIASEFIETSTRLGEFTKVYKKAKKAKLTEKEALERGGFEGRDITVDFAKMGTQIQAFNMISAFFNARLQGYAKIYDGFKNRPGATLTKIGMYITLPSILLWIKNHDDPRYQALPRWQKDLFWIFYTSDDPDATAWRIPKPFELGILFGTGAEKILDMLNSENPKKIQKFIKEFAVDNLKTLGPIPDFVKPAIETWSNRSFFTNRPIIPRDMEGILPEYQWTTYTSETAKVIGKGLRYILGDQSLMSSPVVIDNVIANWTGTLGNHILNIADKALIDSGVVPDPVKPAKTIADMPVVKAFVVRNPSLGSEFIEDFYNLYVPVKKRIDSIDKINNSSEKIRQLKILEKEIGMESLSLIGIADALSAQRQMINLVTQNKDIEPQEKRQIIDDTVRMMIMIAKHGVENLSK